MSYTFLVWQEPDGKTLTRLGTGVGSYYPSQPIFAGISDPASVFETVWYFFQMGGGAGTVCMGSWWNQKTSWKPNLMFAMGCSGSYSYLTYAGPGGEERGDYKFNAPYDPAHYNTPIFIAGTPLAHIGFDGCGPSAQLTGHFDANFHGYLPNIDDSTTHAEWSTQVPPPLDVAFPYTTSGYYAIKIDVAPTNTAPPYTSNPAYLKVLSGPNPSPLTWQGSLDGGCILSYDAEKKQLQYGDAVLYFDEKGLLVTADLGATGVHETILGPKEVRISKNASIMFGIDYQGTNVVWGASCYMTLNQQNGMPMPYAVPLTTPPPQNILPSGYYYIEIQGGAAGIQYLDATGQVSTSMTSWKFDKDAQTLSVNGNPAQCLNDPNTIFSLPPQPLTVGSSCTKFLLTTDGRLYSVGIGQCIIPASSAKAKGLLKNLSKTQIAWIVGGALVFLFVCLIMLSRKKTSVRSISTVRLG